MWTYDMTNHLMIKLETIMALATMTYIVKTKLYELHPTDEQMFNGFINFRTTHVLLRVFQTYFPND